MKIAAIQMVSGTQLQANLDRARHWIEQAAAQGARLVSLPEYFCLMGHHDGDKLAFAERAGDLEAPIQGMLSRAARDTGTWVLGGTLPMALEGQAAPAERVRNTTCVFAPDGTLAARYDKLHLFRYDNGREHYDEGRVLEAGDTPSTVTVHMGRGDADLRIGLSVCYDLRFPELYRAMSFQPGQPPLDLISVPAAFTYTTGQAHWELLLRARAVENQAFVIAAAQGGQHENGRRTWGHSMIIDPWGEVLARVPEGEGLAIADIDPLRLKQVRTQLPALNHRRL
ncbi:carbon-nitrogen hydrolase family protein [Roseateles sp. SL47]|jgi:deaminated glutathione amidase|uniref:carbon-nitrogen hydrolase family protein n=1 Tax=Roseateles sp. SL47 TaxID=2995138 RepID=UPI00226FB01E|nr:carbon-nitrogen hydrolase family protein [Roseateles sp. SL47]WAC74480.1 carbon-nitrogen hydrolase family protein [Roseateles sp. SL47]